jgi:PAS domain S-box-containing protein
MSLRKLTFWLVAITTAGLVGVVLINITQILKNHFEQQEKNGVYLNILQVKNAINRQTTFLENTSNDWANWEDTYNFVETGDPQYIKDNFQPITFQNLDIDLLIIVNIKSNIMYGGVIDNHGQFSNRIPLGIKDHLQPNGQLLSNPKDELVKNGLISINDQPMIIISHPILKTDATGPSRGTLLLGKYIDKEVLDDIDNLLSLSIEISPIAYAQKNDKYALALSYKPNEKDPYFVDLTTREVYGYAVLNDIFNQPTFILRLNRFPAIYNNGILVKNYLITSVVMISITFITILFLLIEFNVLHRIRQLSLDVQNIGTSGDINKRLVVKRKDEISLLALKINDMLGALEGANLQRRESENRFRTLVESMDDVVFTAERENQKVHVYEKKRSPDGTVSNQYLLQADILQVDLENELLNQWELLKRSFQGESTTIEWSSRSQNTVRNFITTLSPIYSSQKDIMGVVGVSKDITSQKKLEQDLRNRINELGVLFNISQQLLSEIKEDTILEIICRLAVDQLGMDAAWIGILSPDDAALIPAASSGLKLESLNNVELYPRSDKSLHPAAVAFNQKELILFSRALTDCDTRAPDSEQNDAAAIPMIQSGKTLAVLVMIKREEPYIRNESLPMIHAYVNLSSVAMQNAQLFKQVLKGRERLKSISRRLVDIQEEERRRIAHELHDELGQILTSLRLSVDMIHSLPNEKLKSQTLLSVDIIDDLIARVRQMSLSLRPSMLDDLGIIPTLFWS